MGGFNPRERTEYQTSCATCGWAYRAIKAGKRAVRRSRAAGIRIPVLLFQATEDAFVRVKEQELFLSRILSGRMVLVKLRHEIYRTTGEKLKSYLTEMFTFFQK